MTEIQPILHSRRLLLRPFGLADAKDVQRLAGDKRIAATTSNIPHPYPDGAAEQWIGGHQDAFARKATITFAITNRESGQLIGAVGLTNISLRHACAEVVYWVGVEYWSQGYCSEATQTIIEYASQSLGVSRIVARCFSRNRASARVMEKVGMRHEGTLPLHMEKWGQYEDVLLYGMCLPGRAA